MPWENSRHVDHVIWWGKSSRQRAFRSFNISDNLSKWMNIQYSLGLAKACHKSLRLLEVVAFNGPPLSVSGSKNHVLNLPNANPRQITSARNSLTSLFSTMPYMIPSAVCARYRLRACCGTGSILNLILNVLTSNASGTVPAGCALRLTICSRTWTMKKWFSASVPFLSPTFGKER